MGFHYFINNPKLILTDVFDHIVCVYKLKNKPKNFEAVLLTLWKKNVRFYNSADNE